MLVGMVCSGVRAEEKMLSAAFEARGVALEVIDDRQVHGSLAEWPRCVPRADAVLLRSKSHWRNLVMARWLERHGLEPVNPSRVLETCGDKVSTSLALSAAGVPVVDASVSFHIGAGREAAEAIGFPLVLKPVIGSWGRLISKVNDHDALELALEHKEAIGGASHVVTYMQPFVRTGGRDIRSFVVDGRCIAAISRTSDGWRTNTALGARATGLKVTEELARVSQSAAEAVGGGVVAVDLFEDDTGFRVNEVNGTMEFRNSVGTTGVDIPGAIADFVIERARSETTHAGPKKGVSLPESHGAAVGGKGFS
jgi:[lysine-biosynthesis-protein LysW]--L-2-aminoadipate ligase